MPELLLMLRLSSVKSPFAAPLQYSSASFACPCLVVVFSLHKFQATNYGLVMFTRPAPLIVSPPPPYLETYGLRILPHQIMFKIPK